MRTIAVLNQKGGVGKTTTVANLGAALAALGRRVCVVDLDPQSHLTLHLGLETGTDSPSIYRVLLDGMPAEQAIVSVGGSLFAVGSHIDLAAAEMELVSVVGREVILRDALEKVRDRFDICLIDCPPSLGVLTLNALAAAREVIIPLQPHFLALQGFGKLLETIALVSRRINQQLTVRGVLLCLYESGTRLSGEVVSDLESYLESARGADLPWSQARVFRTVIRRNVRLAESPSYGKAIFDYAPKCHGAEDYASLAREVLGVSGEGTDGSEVPSGRVEQRAEASPSAAGAAAVSAPQAGPRAGEAQPVPEVGTSSPAGESLAKQTDGADALLPA